VWQVQLPNASAALFSSLRAHFTQYLDTVMASDTLAQKTCRYLLQKQRLACAELPDVARALQLTVAQYRRQLAAEQTSFSRIQLELKRAQAVRRLLASQERLEVLAQEFGFTERSAFERAFSHWYACTPSQFRRELQRHFNVVDFPSWESPHAWPFPLHRQAALHAALQEPHLNRAELVAIWQFNPKLCALLLAELNQPECGALPCGQVSVGLMMLSPDVIKSIGYAAIGFAKSDLDGNTQPDYSAWHYSYFLHRVCQEQKLDPHGALSADWASFFCLLAGGSPNMNLAYYSQRAAVLLASWGVPHSIVRRLFLWGAEKSDEYEMLNAALMWSQQPQTTPAQANWPILWQQTLDVFVA
jgi:AraC-like DNA-binding protein